MRQLDLEQHEKDYIEVLEPHLLYNWIEWRIRETVKDFAIENGLEEKAWEIYRKYDKTLSLK